MTELSRLHDRLVQADGHECHCETWGAWNCPAMQAAIARRKRETSPSDSQLQLADMPPQGPMEGGDWGGFGDPAA